MSDEPISFAEARALKERNSTLWSVEDMLRKMLREIEAGTLKPSKALVLYAEPAEDGGSVHRHFAAGMPGYEHTLAMLEIAKAELMQSWKA